MRKNDNIRSISKTASNRISFPKDTRVLKSPSYQGH